MNDLFSKQAVVECVYKALRTPPLKGVFTDTMSLAIRMVNDLPSAQPDASKYEYHYDHTDCIWYGDGNNKCPSTCSQYRDGWNDAMQYIFGNGKGYKPYRRDGHHE